MNARHSPTIKGASIPRIVPIKEVTDDRFCEIVKSTIVRTNNLHNVLSVLTFAIYICILIISIPQSFNNIFIIICITL